METSKICTKCKITKKLISFGKYIQTEDGLNNTCKQCNLDNAKKYNRTREGLITAIHSHQVSHSKTRQMDIPTYSKEELKEWILSQPNFEPLYINWVMMGYIRDLIPSVDRLDDYKSYELTNIRLVTFRENYKKAHYDKKNKINRKCYKPIYQYDLSENLIKEFISIQEASDDLGINRSNIGSCCNGKRKVAGGFIWKYKNDIIKLLK